MSRARREGRSATSVGAGILLSRLTGFLRDLVIARFFGTTLAADAYAAAIKIPNVLRNLLGEGALSAAFVPVYSSLLDAEPEESEAPSLLARRVLGRLVLLAGFLSAVGVALAPWLTRIVAPGFDPTASELTTELVRILFPMAGVMILAAWCLGVLNSHRRFFLPFAAPTFWNLAQVAGLLLGARFGWTPLIHVLAWSTLAGALLQLAVQLPTARRLAPPSFIASSMARREMSSSTERDVSWESIGVCFGTPWGSAAGSESPPPSRSNEHPPPRMV